MYLLYTILWYRIPQPVVVVTTVNALMMHTPFYSLSSCNADP